MKTEQLSEEAKIQLDRLLEAIANVLGQQTGSPHLKAVSASNFLKDNPSVFCGGSMVAPGKPQFTYDQRAIDQLHRALLERAMRDAYRVIVTGQRPDVAGQWVLDAKLVSRAEQDALEAACEPVNSQIEAQLRTVQYVGRLERISFSRWKGGPEVCVKVEGKALERRPPSAGLMELLAFVDKVYEHAGLKLVKCDWVLRPEGFEYQEYYE